MQLRAGRTTSRAASCATRQRHRASGAAPDAAHMRWGSTVR